MTTVYLNDQEASYIDLKTVQDTNAEGWFNAVDIHGQYVHIPISSILYVVEEY